MENLLRSISYEHRAMEGCHNRHLSKVSICIPNYNKEDYIYACINSALNQTYDNIEIIIVDDCSTDSSHEQIMSFVEKYPKIIYQRLPKRCGTAWAQNIAYYLSSGEFIANLDSDDWCSPRRIFSQVSYLESNDLDLVGSSVRILDSDHSFKQAGWVKKDTAEIVADLNQGKCPICFGSLLFKAKILEELGGLNKRYIGTEDYEFIMRAHNSGYKIGNSPDSLYIYRDHPNQRSKLFHKN